MPFQLKGHLPFTGVARCLYNASGKLPGSCGGINILVYKAALAAELSGLGLFLCRGEKLKEKSARVHSGLQNAWARRRAQKKDMAAVCFQVLQPCGWREELSCLESSFCGNSAWFRNTYREHSLSKCLYFCPRKEALQEQEGSVLP